MSLETILLLIGGGLLAGFINTVAGGGSAITLPILVEMVQLPATVANGTNRVAILLQNVVGVTVFNKGRAVPWRRVVPLLPAILLGAAAGAETATRIPADAMRTVFGVVIVLVAASVVFRPSQWLGGREARLVEPWRSLAFFGIGFYGGFVQAGVGFLLLAGLVLGGGLNLVKGNAAKVVLVLCFTVPALIAFILKGHVDFLAGVILAVGNMSGAYIAARLALQRGSEWIRWVLVAAALAAATRMLFF